jgi:hypothetical protein
MHVIHCWIHCFFIVSSLFMYVNCMLTVCVKAVKGFIHGIAPSGAELSLTASTELLSQHGTKVFGLGASVMRLGYLWRTVEVVG